MKIDEALKVVRQLHDDFDSTLAKDIRRGINSACQSLCGRLPTAEEILEHFGADSMNIFTKEERLRFDACDTSSVAMNAHQEAVMQRLFDIWNSKLEQVDLPQNDA